MKHVQWPRTAKIETNWRRKLIHAVRSPAERPRLGYTEILLSNRLEETRRCRNIGYRHGRCTAEVYVPRSTQIGWAQQKWWRIEDRVDRGNVGWDLLLSNCWWRKCMVEISVLWLLLYLLLLLCQLRCNSDYPDFGCCWWLRNSILLLWRGLLRST